MGLSARGRNTSAKYYRKDGPGVLGLGNAVFYELRV